MFVKFFLHLTRASSTYPENISILSLDVCIVANCYFLYVSPLLWLRFAPCLYVVLSTSVWCCPLL
jgi:hypothetical protein